MKLFFALVFLLLLCLTGVADFHAKDGDVAVEDLHGITKIGEETR